MATILDSVAAFNARAVEHGLTNEQLQRLQREGISTLAQLAFALTTPGTSPTDEALKGLLSDDTDTVTVGQLSSIRRLTFDAQTLSAAQVKHILAGSEAAKKAELVPAERTQRIQDQRNRLAGMDLTGPYECSYASYDYVAKMIEQNAPSYLEQHRFTTRSAEVARENLGKSLCWTRCTSQSKTWRTRINAPCKGNSRSFKPSLEGHWLVTSWGFALFAAWRSGTDFSWTPCRYMLRLATNHQRSNKFFARTVQAGFALQKKLMACADVQMALCHSTRPWTVSRPTQQQSFI